MVLFLLVQKCLEKNSRHVMQTLSFLRLFSSHKFAFRGDNEELANALRITDVVSTKTGGAKNLQSHLRLIEGMLGSNAKAFVRVNSVRMQDMTEMRDAVNKIVPSSGLQTENLISIHLDQNERGVGVDAHLLSHAVSTCGSKCDLRGGLQYHCLAIITGYIANVYVGSSLVSLYSKCALLEDAYRAFEEMPIRNVVLWTAIIAAFSQESHIDKCLELFHCMRKSALKPNEFTYTSLLSACMGSGALGQGRSAHCQIIQMGFYAHLHIANALVTMYCKSGVIQDALYIFEHMKDRDVVTWNSMIAGFAQHGHAKEAIDLFEKMKFQGVSPDAITFLGVLSSCRHAGFVKEGWLYFNSMAQHGLKPDLDHYSCIIDLLGRAGLLLEAQDFIQNMPVYPNAVIWGSLLSSSRLHGSVWIGIQAAESRLLLEPGCPATLLQLANLYASVGWWDQVARVRKMMKDKGLKTNPGYSWIEIKNEVHRFGVEDKSNSRMVEVVTLMGSLIDHMRSSGLPQMPEEEDVMFT
ncbi:hypothetical protein QN277_012912 [Acacia crassicarpa]|uniref:Pentatricopeptide repeat-containing protein n=1 Tax=Acacia crassicarpa TaxID=499986 RepID=A0AAE1TDW1_9FABA|nr:hypothetical protein QN277_012912 [Acacia crassicarpa]